jgi:hypothetical protein
MRPCCSRPLRAWLPVPQSSLLTRSCVSCENRMSVTKSGRASANPNSRLHGIIAASPSRASNLTDARVGRLLATGERKGWKEVSNEGIDEQQMALNDTLASSYHPQDSSVPRRSKRLRYAAHEKRFESALTPNPGDVITAIKHPAKRKNIPPAGLEAQGVLRQAPQVRYEYNPHLPPVLRSAPHAKEADKLPELLATARQRALSAEEAKLLATALRRHEPWLEWSGKREKPWFEVDPVPLHMHERNPLLLPI